MRFLYGWALGMRNSQLTLFVGTSFTSVRELLNGWYQMLQENIRDNDVKIGGPGIIVELNESKFGKRKYHQGHRVEGVWIFDGIERTDERKCFLVAVPNRTARTLLDVIERHVLPGSIIHTDCWRACNRIEELGQLYEHFTVNHSVGYVTEEGVHTNTIEDKLFFYLITTIY